MPAAIARQNCRSRRCHARSNQVANFLRAQGLKRGDHLLLLLGNVVPLWETMLAAMKLGVVVIPATTLLTPDELRDRLDRGRARVVVATQDQVAKFAALGGGQLVRIVVGASAKQDGWLAYEQAGGAPETFAPIGRNECRRADAAVLHVRYHRKAKAGAAQPAQLPRRRIVDDVLARPAARRCPSEYFLAGLGQARLELLLCALECRRHRVRGQPAALRCQGAACDHRAMRRHHAVRAADGMAAVHPGEPRKLPVSLREVCGAGEPLNPEVIDQVRAAWGLTIRDGYGQTETTALAGNSPGQKVKVGSMGRPLPGYRVQITDIDGHVTKEGEVTLVLGDSRRPITLPTSDFRISTLKINLRPCSTLVTRTSSGASTSCLMTNSRKVSTGLISGSGSGRNFLTRLQNHARDSCARLSAMPHPIVDAVKVQTKVFPCLARIIVADSLYKFPVARAALVCHHNTVKRPVFGSFSP